MCARLDKTYYLGLCVTYHDPALAILGPDGEILYAEATERYLQYKRALDCEPDNLGLVPQLLARHCGDAEAFVIGFNWQASRPLWERAALLLGWLTPKGILHREGRRLHTWVPMYQLHHMQAAQHHAIRRRAIHLARTLKQDFPGVPVRFQHYDHHLTHAALACYGSPFDEAACAVIDSYGEEGSMAFYRYRDGHLSPIHASRGPQSLGFYYMKLTELCGFDWIAGEEWKVMGLASYGQIDGEILDRLRRTMEVDGLNLKTRYPEFFPQIEALEARRRPAGTPPEQAADLAHSGQAFFTEIVNRLLGNLQETAGSRNLAFSGGCALNSSYNGQLLGNTPFENLHVPSAPADDGTALGAALLAYQADHPGHRWKAEPISPYLGSTMDERAVERFAQYGGLPVRHLPDGAIVAEAARLLANGKIMGWVQGRAEFGPRALGNRSILADPRRAEMGERVNRDVKFRERFRPYAPSILHENGPEWFEDYQDTPYMDRTLRFKSEAAGKAPAVVHVDGTGRLQSVTQERNHRYHALLSEFHRLTDVPVLLNTSFNVMGKPIVHGVEDAFGVFLGSGLDALVIGDHLFTKPEAAP